MMEGVCPEPRHGHKRPLVRTLLQRVRSMSPSPAPFQIVNVKRPIFTTLRQAVRAKEVVFFFYSARLVQRWYGGVKYRDHGRLHQINLYLTAIPRLFVLWPKCWMFLSHLQWVVFMESRDEEFQLFQFPEIVSPKYTLYSQHNHLIGNVALHFFFYFFTFQVNF